MCVGHGLRWDDTGVDNEQIVRVENLAVGVDDSGACARTDTSQISDVVAILDL